MYVQQVLTRGHEVDIRELLTDISPEDFRTTFAEIKHFLPVEVRLFWEDFFADYYAISN